MVLCFREGCPYAANEAGGIEVVHHLNTHGQIGGSKAELKLPFCSPGCATKFHSDYPTQKDMVGAILRLLKE